MSERASKIGIVLITILLALVSIPTPRVPSEAELDATADASWSAVLGYAHRHGLQFGTDLVFTYGPLGFLATPFASSDQIGLRLATDALLSLAAGAGVTLVAWRLATGWKWLLTGSFIFLSANIYPRNDLLIEIGLLCWGLLALVETGPMLVFATCLFVVVAAFAALVKILLLILAAWSVCLVGYDFVLRGNGRLGLGLVAGFAILFLLGWVGLGQHLVHLGTFLTGAVSTSEGYNQAMGYEGSLELRWRALITLAAIAGTIMVRVMHAFEGNLTRWRWRKVLLAAWLVGVVFLVWKHGFVRTDLYHAGFYFGFAPILVLALGVLQTGQNAAKVWGGAFPAICWFVCLVTVQSMVLPADLKSSLLQPLRSLQANAARLALPAAHRKEVSNALAAEREHSQLPGLRHIIGGSSVDMFGCEQTLVLCNDLAYHPRPVFQSYAAYNTPLMRLNEAFYLSASAPEYVLFRLMALDRKFPPLEDARVLRHLLINYEPAGTEGPFLLLKARTKTPAELTLLHEGEGSLGQQIPLNQYGDADLWIQIDVKPTLLGRMRQFLYQPSKVRLAVWYTAGEEPKARRFRAPTPMLASGFLLSPLMLSNEDVLRLYEGTGFVRPSACVVELNRGTEEWWQRQISFRVYRIDTRLGRCVPSGFKPGGAP